MSYVLSEAKMIPAVSSLMDYCNRFWDELGDWRIPGSDIGSPTDFIAALAELAAPDYKSQYFIAWLTSSDPAFAVTARFGPYQVPNKALGRLWPPPVVFWYHGTYIRPGPFPAKDGTKTAADDYSIQMGSLLTSGRLSQAKNRRLVTKLKHHRAGYTLERGTFKKAKAKGL